MSRGQECLEPRWWAALHQACAALERVADECERARASGDTRACVEAYMNLGIVTEAIFRRVPLTATQRAILAPWDNRGTEPAAMRAAAQALRGTLSFPDGMPEEIL